MKQHLFRQTCASESVCDQLILRLNKIDLNNSFIELIRKIELMSLTHRRIYKEEKLEEIHLSPYIRDTVACVTQDQGLRLTAPNYYFDDIWLQKDKAVLLAVLVHEFLTDLSKTTSPVYSPKIEIACRFAFGKLEFSYATLEPAEPLVKMLSGQSVILAEEITQSLGAETLTSVKDDNRYILAMKN